MLLQRKSDAVLNSSNPQSVREKLASCDAAFTGEGYSTGNKAQETLNSPWEEMHSNKSREAG